MKRKPSESSPEFQLPPHDVSSEQAVLACILETPDEAMPEVLKRVTEPKVFYELRHQAIFSAMVSLHHDHVGIDTITLRQRLASNGGLEASGGDAYIGELAGMGLSVYGLEPHIQTIIEKRALREMAQVYAKFKENSDNIANGDTATAIAGMELAAAKILTDLQATEKSHLSANELMCKVVDWIEHRHKTQGEMSGIATGFVDFDAITDGLQFHEHAIIAARPSIGKTQIALDIMRHVCIEAAMPLKALFISAEMRPEALLRRLIAAVSRVPLKAMKKGVLTEANFKAIIPARARISKAPMQFQDATAGIRASAVAARICSAAKQGVKLVIVDYLQKIRPDDRHEKRTYEVAQVSELLTAAARRSGVALLTLAQLNRESERDKGRPPRLSDLADSGQLERDADLVALLHRDRNESDGDASLIIAKQRDGETGMVKLHFTGQICRFDNSTNEHEP